MPIVDARRHVSTAMRLGAIAATLLAPVAARAEPTAEERFAFAEATLTTESESGHRSRLLVNGLSIGLGAATAGVGGVLLAREVQAGPILLTAQGGLIMFGGFYGLLWRRDPFEELMGTLATIKRQNGPTAASMHALQVRWYELATKERRWRTVQGGATTALGGALVAAAAVIAAIPNDMDPTVRALYSRMLLGSGVAGVGAGLSSLLIPSGIERGYSPSRAPPELPRSPSPRSQAARASPSPHRSDPRRRSRRYPGVLMNHDRTGWMKRSLGLGVCALVAAVAAPGSASAEPPSSEQAAPPPIRERLGGRFVFVGGAKQVAAKDAAIDKATDDMFIVVRGTARSKLREVTAVSPSVAIAFKDGNVTVTSADGPQATSPESGAVVAHKNREGKDSKLSQKLGAETLTQSLSSDAGGRSSTFAASKDGKTLTVTHVISSPRLPAPVRYTLTYQRS